MAEIQARVSGRNKEHPCYGRNIDWGLGKEKGASLL